MENKGERAKIIDEIEQLKNANEKIRAEIDKINAKDEKIRARTMIGDGIDKMYWKMPVNWLETVFYTRKKELKELGSACMSDDCIEYVRHSFNFCNLDYATHVAQIAGLCEAVLETEEGICLALRDPYQRFKTTPINITTENAYKLVGKIIIIDGNIQGTNKTEVKTYRYKPTSFTLTGTAEKKDEVTDIIPKLALELKGITSEEDAIKGITAMQNYARAAIKNCKVLRTSPIEARFLHKDENELVRLYGVRYEDGGIWFMEDSSGHDFEPDAGKEYQQLFGEKFVNDTTVEVIRTGRWRFFCIDENPPEIKENI